MATRNSDGTAFSSGPIFFHDQPAVFARGDIQACRFLVMDCDSIDANIDPVVVRVLLDNQATRANVTVPVMLVPLRCRKGQQIHIISSLNIFINRTILDNARRERRIPFRILPPSMDQLHLAGFWWQTQCQGNALG